MEESGTVANAERLRVIDKENNNVNSVNNFFMLITSLCFMSSALLHKIQLMSTIKNIHFHENEC